MLIFLEFTQEKSLIERTAIDGSIKKYENCMLLDAFHLIISMSIHAFNMQSLKYFLYDLRRNGKKSVDILF